MLMLAVEEFTESVKRVRESESYLFVLAKYFLMRSENSPTFAATANKNQAATV